MLFPATCFDNFYKNPKEIRDWALSLPFDDPDNILGVYPGVRTKMLHTIDQMFFDSFCKKLLSIFFDLHNTEISWNVQTHFQLITPFTDSDLNHGWAHTDDGSVFGGVIYLDEENDEEAGTSVGEIDLSTISEDEYNNLQNIRTTVYKGNPKKEEFTNFKKQLLYNNKLYNPTIEFKNKFNRLICFDGTQPHKANFGNKKTARLTQVFFVSSMDTDSPPPVIRSKQFNHISI